MVSWFPRQHPWSTFHITPTLYFRRTLAFLENPSTPHKGIFFATASARCGWTIWRANWASARRRSTSTFRARRGGDRGHHHGRHGPPDARPVGVHHQRPETSNTAEKICRVVDTMGNVLSRLNPVLLRDLKREAPALKKLDDMRSRNIPLVFGRLIQLGMADGSIRADVEPEFVCVPGCRPSGGLRS